MRALIIVCVMLAAGCTPAERAQIVKSVTDIAAEVCVEGDTVKACLRKCEAAAAD